MEPRTLRSPIGLLVVALLTLLAGCDQSGTAPEWSSLQPTADIEVIDLSPVRGAFPTPRPDTVSVAPLKSVIIEVLKNDADTIRIARSIPDTVRAAGLLAIPVFPTLVRVTQPKHGVVRINANGTVTYQGTDPQAWGEDTFNYTVVNERGLSASATVTVLIGLQWKLGLRWPPPPDSTKTGGH